MGRITVHAGDFIKGSDHFFNFRSFTLKTDVWQWLGETISSDQLLSVEIASEESVKKLGSTVAWGAVGALALGPLGLLAGVLAGGNKKEVTFVAEFKDGRRMLASTDSKTFTQIKAAIFSPRAPTPLPALSETEATATVSEPPAKHEPGVEIVANDMAFLIPIAIAVAFCMLLVGFAAISSQNGNSYQLAENVKPRVTSDDDILDAIKQSNYFRFHKDAFLIGTKTLVMDKGCSLKSISDAGGWKTATEDWTLQTFFTFCGPPLYQKRWYITIPSGRVFQNPY